MSPRKHITIEDRHDDFLDDMNLNLSGEVQDHLDDLIREYGWDGDGDA